MYYDGTIEDWCNITFSNYYSNPMNYANHFYIKNSNGEYEEVTEVVILNNITSIDDYQFCNLSSAKNIIIPCGVIRIGSSAFDGCNSLTSIKIPNSVMSIGAGSVARYSNLTKIEIPNSVLSIGSYAFYECTSLIIYCEAEAKSETWNDDWNSMNCKVFWKYNKH